MALRENADRFRAGGCPGGGIEKSGPAQTEKLKDRAGSPAARSVLDCFGDENDPCRYLREKISAIRK